MYIPLNGAMDLRPVQLAPIITAGQELDVMGESLTASSKKRKRAAENLDLRELVSQFQSPSLSADRHC